ncbi:RNA methyltransferase [Novosphingobium marinum]|uniref:Precorrin-6B methylase 2 n=1 Tax=Novosphingobium marinum TaxID=1514948 RepID=A0A7Y9Y0C5_9SPHN|nr:methyltransferase domain-containing protein [Novosphingobium marinum]NYH96316.1 precorrin-6B methylase 2 [Novosphingobium marinum]GGC34289.1 RNA methyltransferase [Novosphingobium marinum]
MPQFAPLLLGALAFSLAATQSTPVDSGQSAPPDKQPDVVYVPTPEPVVSVMLRMANPKRGEVLYDLGSGDGRIPIKAARRYGIHAVGIEIDPELVEQARANAVEAGVDDRVAFRQQDLFAVDLSEADIVTLYLLPELNLKLRSKLIEQLKPGARIVSHAFDMGQWEPHDAKRVRGRVVYLWTIPEP